MQISRTKSARYLLVAILAMLVMILPWNTTSAQEDAGSTNTEDVLRVGMEANYPPFNWSQSSDADGAVAITNSPGEFVNGYDVWVSQEIADSLGLELEILKIDWDGLVPALQSGVIDAIVAGMSPTAERKEVIDFTDIYYTSDLVMVVMGDSEYVDASSIQDFADLRVTAQLSTFHVEALEQIEGLVPQTPMDSFPTMMTALMSGSIDAYVSERPAALSAVASNPELTFVSFDENNGFQTNTEDTAVAVGLRKGSSLATPINGALAEISEAERQTVMAEMIETQTADGDGNVGFWGSVSEILSEYGPLFLRGATITMLIAIISTIIGFIIGLIVQVIRETPTIKNRPLRNGIMAVINWILTAYIEIFRGTPMMVQSMLIFYGSRLLFDIEMSIMGAALFIVSINTGAYLAEVIKGGIRSVDQGQFEAAKSIGLTHGQTMRQIILPQTINAILPSVANEFVVNIKDTSVLNVISVTELFFVAQSVAGTTLQVFHTYLIVAVIYFVLTFVTTRIINWIGKRNGATKEFSLRSVTT